MQAEERKKPTDALRSILHCYVKRNPSVGYCQGMNFIGANLLECMDEEDAFWTLTQIIENYLPLEYYSNMLGVVLDQKVLYDLLERHLPEMYDHFEACSFNLDLLSFQWLVCLFSGKLREDTVNTIWNLFLLRGISIIFRVALTILKTLEEDIFELERFDEILIMIQNYSETEFTPELLLKNLVPDIPEEEIRELRDNNRVQIVQDIRKHVEQSSQKVINPNPRITFIKKFFSFSGLVDYFEENQD